VAVRSEFVGLREANRALRALPEYARVDVQKVMDVTGFNVARGAKARVARRTGLLQMRIGWKSRPRSLSAVVGVERDAYYWKVLEYGTKHMDAQPFMRPAALAEEDNHGRAVVQALERANATMERAAASRLL
jgi:HK97 gp10 family phage protein